MKPINIETWNRREHFAFFSGFDEPFFGIVSEVDCSSTYESSKKNNFSFFASYLYKSLVAVNGIPEFRYRINKNEVVIYDTINASPTIGREDGTFGFGFIPFDEDFRIFAGELSEEISRIKNSAGLGLNENTSRKDVIHYSSIPWIKFSSVTHARNFKFADSVPKITFGKISKTGDTITLPVSVNCHHGLMDALHVYQFLELFQELLNEK
jgi:chloramphenicol O-acetyltransferase type A